MLSTTHRPSDARPAFHAGAPPETHTFFDRATLEMNRDIWIMWTEMSLLEHVITRPT